MLNSQLNVGVYVFTIACKSHILLCYSFLTVFVFGVGQVVEVAKVIPSVLQGNGKGISQ